MDIYEKIAAMTADISPQLTAWRRDLHRYPEPGWQEIRTCAIIAQHLTDWGYEVLAGEPVFDPDARMGLPPQAELDAAYHRAIRQGASPFWANQFKNGFTGVIGILRCGEGPTLALRFDIDGLRLDVAYCLDHEFLRRLREFTDGKKNEFTFSHSLFV